MSALEGTTTLPVLGKAKKSYVAVGVALVLGIAGWAWYRRADLAGDDTAVSPYADTRTGSELPTDEYVNPAPSSSADSSTTGEKAPTTDPEWAARVIEKLSWYEPGYVSAVVGKYLAKQPITAEEQGVIREAWAQVGRPPGGQSIVVGTTPTAAAALVAPTGARTTVIGPTSARLDWGNVPGATGYRVGLNGAYRETTYLSEIALTGLKKSTKYTVQIQGRNAGSTYGPAATVTFTTHAK